MWTLDAAGGSRLTNKVVIPTDGKIEVASTGNTKVMAYVNDELTQPLSRLWGKAGDAVHFEIKGDREMPSTVTIQYGGTTDTLEVPARGPKIITTSEGSTMTPTETLNLFATTGQGGNMGGALGGGLGAGLLGGLLGTVLFRNQGLGGADGQVATQAGVESVVNNSTIQQTLGDIKASIPFAEGQAQLAIAQSQADINSNISAHSDTLNQSMNMIALNAANNASGLALAISNGIATVNSNVNSNAQVTNAAIANASILAERNAWALTQTITNDGDKTRALIQSIDKTNDSRLIAAQAAEISDLKNTGRLVEATGNITISNSNTATAAQQQNQFQTQQQLQYQILSQLAAVTADLQSVKQNSVVFNSGLMAGSGNQTAANTRVA